MSAAEALSRKQFHAALVVKSGADGYTTAYHPDHGYVGELVPKTDSHELGNIEVDRPFRRRGVATRMWESAQAAGAELEHSPLRTPQGNHWAQAIGGDIPKRQTPEEYYGVSPVRIIRA